MLGRCLILLVIVLNVGWACSQTGAAMMAPQNSAISPSRWNPSQWNPTPLNQPPSDCDLAALTRFRPPTSNSNSLRSAPDLRAEPTRPRGIPISLGAEWISGSELDLTTYDTSVKLPILLRRKSPPPIVKIGFDYTDFSNAEQFGIPEDLYEYSIGLSWVRKLNDRWAVRTMLGVGMATDNLNISSDAWQFRGGVFAMYEANPQWTWTLGAIALGRRDLPVLPAVGAVWLPNETTRVDLLMPNPKANFLLADDGRRQQWAYVGAGLNGNSWAFESPDGIDDVMTYGDARLVCGWESRPTAPPGAPFVLGRKFNVELGYSFSRDLEFENGDSEVSLEDALLFRLSTSY